MNENTENNVGPDVHNTDPETTEIAQHQFWSAEEERKHRSGILSTAYDPSTKMPAQEINEDTLVSFHNGDRKVQLPVRLAVKYGVLTKDQQSGEYREPSEQEHQEHIDSLTTPPEPEPFERVSLGDQEEQYVDNISQFFQNNGIDPVSVISEYIGSNATTEPKAIGELARRTGISQENISKHFATAVGLFEGQMTKFVQENGLNPEEFFPWMNGNVPSHTRNSAMLRHIVGKDLRPLKSLINSFKDANGYGKKNGVFAPEGTQVKYSNTGEKFIEVPGYPPMRLETAKRMGIVG